ncbi:hypothetical protein BRPE64_ACDS01560 [Caballeronia insecticola]|uniref:Uncharacterized protein n=1 Tax=Caballeronia insecticola TaxID=758793 RepID=R4WM43_9BURK|nr:hypothetical protein BRPE64_ACDS01560 [Caballeronia insecticola]
MPLMRRYIYKTFDRRMQAIHAREQPSFQFYAGFGRPKTKSDKEAPELALRHRVGSRENTALTVQMLRVLRLVLPWVRSETCAWGMFNRRRACRRYCAGRAVSRACVTTVRCSVR